MELLNNKSSYLLGMFEAFHRELVRQRRSVEAGGQFAGEVLLQRTGGTALERTEAVWQQLLSLLERQALLAGQNGGAFGYEIYREAQYVMAALTDEVFLHINWQGKDSWVLLESRLFQTHVAGEVIFQRIDGILQQRDPFYVDLAAVYFMALALGFQGKYRDGANKAELNQYQQQLFRFIYRRPSHLIDSTAPLFPDAVQNVLESGPGKKLPDQKIWLLLVALVLVLWVGISELGWRSIRRDVSQLITAAEGRAASGAQPGGKR